MSSFDCLKACTAFLICRLTKYLTMASSSSLEPLLLRGCGVGSLCVTFGLMLNSDFITLFFAYLEAIDPISLVVVSSVLFTILTGLDIVSRHDIPLQSSSFFISLTCLGVTESSLVLNLY